MATNPFDQQTESDRERVLMDRVRSAFVPHQSLHDSFIDDSLLDDGFPFFLKIQIQTFSPCNAQCTMCPWPSTRSVLPQGRMSFETYTRIIDQLAGRGVERLSLFLMNEPLLDDRLEDWTRYAKSADSTMRTVIFTNGSRLDKDRVHSLARAGMDEINVSFIGFQPSSYSQAMGGLDYDHVYAQLRDIGEDYKKGTFGSLEIKIVSLELPGSLEGIEAFREDTGFDPFVKQLTNRAGSIDVERLGADSPTATEPTACQRPFVKAYILFNGDMVLCNCDWHRTTILGNVHEESLDDLWRGERLHSIRRAHMKKCFPKDSLCAKCDYPYLS